MKILFITDNFPPEVNAPATRTYEHAKEWVKLGADVTILTCAASILSTCKVFKFVILNVLPVAAVIS